MRRPEQERFDRILAEVLDELPLQARQAVETVPIIVDDTPDQDLLRDLATEGLLASPQVLPAQDQPAQPESNPDDIPLGLHSGTPTTEHPIDDHGSMPSVIHLFREPIVEQAGGWNHQDADDRVAEEIRITLLHEIGHHFGLSEDDLDRLGFA